MKYYGINNYHEYLFYAAERVVLISNIFMHVFYMDFVYLLVCGAEN